MIPTADLVPVQRRWWVLTVTRIGLAVGTIATVSIMSDLAGSRRQAVVASCLVYVGVVLGVELLRRGTRARALWLMGLLIMLDGLFLARVVNATGGTLSPLNALVYLQVVAVTLVVSFRVGLESAVWQAALVVILASGPGESIFGATLGPVPAGAALRASSYLIVAVATAAFASLDERALRRAQARLVSEVELLKSFEETDAVAANALVLCVDLVRSLGFSRAAVIVAEGEIAHAVVAVRRGDEVDHAIAEPPSSQQLMMLDRAEEGGAVLLSSLDPERHRVLDGLLPGARNLVVTHLRVDDRPCGVIVAEWPTRWRRQIPLAVIDELELKARYGAMALRSALLLAEVEDRSRRDLVTGLGNRRAFDEAVDREVSRSRRAEGATSVVLVDLDHFKQVNDVAGHQAGDAVLVAVGRALAGAGRPYDLVARIGGDEFGILLPNCELADASRVAERVRQAVWDSVGEWRVSASVGVATTPMDGLSSKELLRQADGALYRAKSAGRNRVATASPGADVETVIDLTADRPLRPSGDRADVGTS